MKTRTSKATGAAAAIVAIAASIPLAINAYADPTPTPQPAVEIPDPQGNCDPFKAAVPNWKALNDEPVSKALASIPDISTFNSAVSGGLNPAVNITSVLDNGPYVVFAPTNDAFAALEPAQLEALKTDPAALTKLDYYHVFLGLLGPEDVHGPASHPGGRRHQGRGQERRHQGQRHRQGDLRWHPGRERAHLHHRHGAGSRESARAADPDRE